jgi:iron complex transport system ATP-binding protein
VIDAAGISVNLAGRVVLHQVDFAAAPGRTVGVVGPNGAGKTSLMRVLAGLAAPIAGSVALDGRALADWPRAALARTLAYLPQGETVHWPIAADRLVALGRLPHLAAWQRPGAEDAAAVARAMQAADVGNLARRPLPELSAGERRRVLIARALAVEAPVLLADEPVAGLDPYHQLEIMELLRATAAAGRTVVVVLHELVLAARFCDSVTVLRDGVVLAAGPARTTLAAEQIARAFDVDVATVSEGGDSAPVPWRRRPKPAGS